MVNSINSMMYNLELLNNKNSKVTYGLASGKALQNGSDDSLKYNHILTIQRDLSTYNAIANNIDLSSSFNTVSDTNISNVKTAFETINSSIMEANTSTTNDDVKLILSNDLESLKDTIFNLLNDSTNGEYLFSGTSTSTIPFIKDEDTGEITYVGSNDNRKVNVEKNTYISQGVTGVELMYYTQSSATTNETLVFDEKNIIFDENGNKWTLQDSNSDGEYDSLYSENSATSLAVTNNNDGTFSVINTENETLVSKYSYFNDIDKLINALKYQDVDGNTISSDEMDEILNEALEKFQTAYDNLNLTHANLGTRVSSIENYSDLVQAKITHYSILEVEFASADLTKLAVESQSLENTYAALYSTISKTNSLSLVNYL